MTDMTKKLALLCTVSVLTLGLAACNSTGTKTPAGGTPTPPAGQGDTSELGTARTAAKTAMDAAKAAWDAAEAEAMKAETAVMGLAGVQTGAMAKKKAMEARTAANAAKAAYDKAKAAHDKAAAATTVTAAAEARLDAEAEQKKAEAEQKKAVAAAKMAQDAAGVEVKVTYDDDGKATYSVGETMIMAGSPKVTTEADGKTQKITGLVEVIKSGAYTARDEVDCYGSGETSACKDNESQPTVAVRQLEVGTKTDSADDSARLRLFDKYVGEKIVSMYIESPTGGGQANGDLPTDDRPYGRIQLVNSGDRSQSVWVEVKRATGEFYKAADSGGYFSPDDSSGLNGGLQTIAAGTMDANAKEDTTGTTAGIYYVIAPFTDNIAGKNYDKGDRIYLRRSGVVGSGDGLKYNYHTISIRENVKLPVAMSYEHMNYGMWAALKDNKDGDNTMPSDMGRAFVNALSGKAMTPAADMPTSGSATYKGHWLANVRGLADDGDGVISEHHGGSETMADFKKNTVAVKLFTGDDPKQYRNPANDAPTPFATMEGAIGGEMMPRNGFSGTKVTVNSGTTVGVKEGGTFTGTMNGNFFGPKFEEVGGVFDFTSEDKKAGEFRGAFGGRRGE